MFYSPFCVEGLEHGRHDLGILVQGTKIPKFILVMLLPIFIKIESICF